MIRQLTTLSLAALFASENGDRFIFKLARVNITTLKRTIRASPLDVR